MGQANFASHMREMQNVYKGLVETTQEKSTFLSPLVIDRIISWLTIGSNDVLL
jgi:hypothetical protein